MTKHPISNRVNVLYFLILIFATTTLNFSCSKDAFLKPTDDINNLENESSVIKWGQTRNGRWLPYLLNKLKQENPDIKKEDISGILSSYLRIIRNADELYAEEFVSEMKIEMDYFSKHRDSIYRTNYEKINTKLGESGMMDALWKHYKSMMNKRSGRVSSIGGGKRLSTNDPPGAVACALPDILEWYFGMFLPEFPNPGNTNLEDLMNMLSEGTCKQKALATIGTNYYYMMAVNNPTGIGCVGYGFAVEQAVWDYMGCPSDDDDDDDDPFPPGGGGNNGGGNNGGGNNGGGSSGGEDCVAAAVELQNLAPGTVDNVLINEIVTEIDPTHRTLDHTWVVFRAPLDIYRFVSHDQSKHMKQNGEWVYQSIQHQNITFSGTSVVVTPSYVERFTPTAEIISTKTAYVTHKFKITATINCGGNPITRTLEDDCLAGRPFIIND